MKSTSPIRNALLQHNAPTWITGISLFVLAEAIVLYIQIAIIGIGLSSLYFWFVPVVISGPTSSAITLYRKSIASLSEEVVSASIASFSYLASTMILVANATILTVILVVLMRLR
jgi:hypothetical protein